MPRARRRRRRRARGHQVPPSGALHSGEMPRHRRCL